MQTYTKVDPELYDALEALGAMGFHQNPVSEQSLHAYRQAIDALHREKPPLDVRGLHVHEIHISASENYEMRAIVYQPNLADGPLPALLFIHGGGFVLGAPEHDQERCCTLARELGAVVVAPAYRLAPENPFPSGLDDCYACLKAMVARAALLNIDPGRIAVYGESAGGGLAASLVQKAVAEDGPKIAFQALHYPMLDHRTGQSQPEKGMKFGEFVWTKESNLFAWSAYLGDVDAEPAKYAVPALAKDLSALPPCFLSTAAMDLFLSEDIAYAHGLLKSGVQTELVVYPGAFHGFDQSKTAVIARKFMSDLLSALRRGLGIDIDKT